MHVYIQQRILGHLSFHILSLLEHPFICVCFIEKFLHESALAYHLCSFQHNFPSGVCPRITPSKVIDLPKNPEVSTSNEVWRCKTTYGPTFAFHWKPQRHWKGFWKHYNTVNHFNSKITKVRLCACLSSFLYHICSCSTVQLHELWTVQVYL